MYERHMEPLLRTDASSVSTGVVLYSERAILVNRMFHVIMENHSCSGNFKTELKRARDEDSPSRVHEIRSRIFYVHLCGYTILVKTLQLV